jgi:hypothetical protein
MKKILIACILSSITIISFAQVQRNAPLPGTGADSTKQAAKATLKQQLQSLNLTKDQKIQIKALHQNGKNDKEAIMANDSLNEDQKKMQLKQLRQQNAANFNAILNNEQREKWNAIKAEAKKNKNNQNNQQEQQAMEDEINSLPAN